MGEARGSANLRRREWENRQGQRTDETSPKSANADQTASSVAEKGRLPTKSVVVGGPESVSLKTFLGRSPNAPPSLGARGRLRSTLTARPSISLPASSSALVAEAGVVNST